MAATLECYSPCLVKRLSFFGDMKRHRCEVALPIDLAASRFANVGSAEQPMTGFVKPKSDAAFCVGLFSFPLFVSSADRIHRKSREWRPAFQDADRKIIPCFDCGWVCLRHNFEK